MIIDCMRDPSRREEAIEESRRSPLDSEHQTSPRVSYLSTPYGPESRILERMWNDATNSPDETRLFSSEEFVAFDVEANPLGNEVREVSPSRNLIDGIAPISGTISWDLP